MAIIRQAMLGPRVKMLQAPRTGPSTALSSAPTARVMQGAQTGRVPAQRGLAISPGTTIHSVESPPLLPAPPIKRNGTAPLDTISPLDDGMESVENGLIPLLVSRRDFFAKIIKAAETFVEGLGEEAAVGTVVETAGEVATAVAAVAEAGGAAAALGTAASLAAILAFIPGIAADIAAMIEAMSPKSALQVTPVVFQSTEQEGRWKPFEMLDAVTSGTRAFVAGKQEQNYEAALNSSSALVVAKPYGKVLVKRSPLFTLKVEDKSVAVIDVNWWYDGLEIWAGLASLMQAIGFGSVYSDTASATLQATVLGNYYPAKVFITWSGWLNPNGNEYWEFRGGIVVSADGRIGNKAVSNLGEDTDNPCFMQQWGRDKKEPIDLKWNDSQGFTLVAKNTYI